MISDLTIARAQGDRVDHTRIVQTPKFATVPLALRVCLAEIAMLSQSVRMPKRVDG